MRIYIQTGLDLRNAIFTFSLKNCDSLCQSDSQIVNQYSQFIRIFALYV